MIVCKVLHLTMTEMTALLCSSFYAALHLMEFKWSYSEMCRRKVGNLIESSRSVCGVTCRPHTFGKDSDVVIRL